MVGIVTEEQIRVLVKEELYKQFGEIRDQIAGLSFRVDKIERESGKEENLLLKFRKYTLKELMAEYNKLKEELHKKTEEPTNI